MIVLAFLNPSYSFLVVIFVPMLIDDCLGFFGPSYIFLVVIFCVYDD